MSEWIEPQHWPALASGEAHVWLAHLPSVQCHLERIAKVLSPTEHERAGKFRFGAHRERWQLTRGILRSTLARYLSMGATEIAFTQNAHGKPALEGPASSGFFFNTSHSGDYAAFSMTRLGETGVDIEKVRDDMPRRDEIAKKYFAQGENEQLQARSEAEHSRAFFDLWTRKEAFVKARGDGLFSGLDQFEVSLAEARVLSLAGETDASNWWMSNLPAIAGYAGAVVVKAAACSPRFWNWSARLIG